jgi:hypothetical protein
MAATFYEIINNMQTSHVQHFKKSAADCRYRTEILPFWQPQNLTILSVSATLGPITCTPLYRQKKGKVSTTPPFWGVKEKIRRFKTVLYSPYLFSEQGFVGLDPAS